MLSQLQYYIYIYIYDSLRKHLSHSKKETEKSLQCLIFYLKYIESLDQERGVDETCKDNCFRIEHLSECGGVYGFNLRPLKEAVASLIQGRLVPDFSEVDLE